MATDFAKEDNRKLKNALKGLDQALVEGNAELADDAADVFEKVGADRLALKARNFAARVRLGMTQKEGENG